MLKSQPPTGPLPSELVPQDASLQRIRQRLSGLAADGVPTPPRVVLDSWQEDSGVKGGP